MSNRYMFPMLISSLLILTKEFMSSPELLTLDYSGSILVFLMVYHQRTVVAAVCTHIRVWRVNKIGARQGAEEACITTITRFIISYHACPETDSI
jgi:hypothetical protein